MNDSAIEQLRLNSPDNNFVRVVVLYLDHFDRHSVHEFVEALLQNTSAKKFEFRVFGEHFIMDEADWVPFRHAISNHSVLQEVVWNQTTEGAQAQRCRHSVRFLEAIATSSSIKCVHVLCACLNSNSLRTFLRTTTSMTTLDLRNLSFVDTVNPAEAALNLSASIAENASIEVLHCARMESFCQTAIFRGLAQNVQIRRLSIDLRDQHINEEGIRGNGGFTLEEAEALRLAMISTNATLEQLNFTFVNFEEAWFSVIFQGIQGSRSVCQISLGDCSFDEGSTRLLRDLFTTPADKRYSFTLNFSIKLSMPTEKFIGNVLRSNACMSELIFEPMFNEAHPVVKSITTALENDSSSILESLFLCIRWGSHFQALVGSLPKIMHLRKLFISIPPDDVPHWSERVLQALWRRRLLEALWRNCCLQQVTGNSFQGLSEVDTAKLKFCAKRNSQIPAIMKAPQNKVPLLTAWPRVFQAVRECEMEASVIFRVLIALGDFVGSSKKRSECPSEEEEGEYKRTCHGGTA
jgi:hypothetical protein